EWGVGNGESGMGSRESGMGSREWGVGSREWGVGSGEWGIGNYLPMIPPHSPLPTPRFRNSLIQVVNEDWCGTVLSMPLLGHCWAIAGPYRRPIEGINCVRLVRRRDKFLQWRFTFCRILLKQR